jgi:hypothetical protein
MILDDAELNQMIASERKKMLDHYETISSETVERLKFDDARGTLYRMIRDVETIAEVCVRHPAIVQSADSFRYAMIIKSAAQALIIAENKSHSDDLWDEPSGDFSLTDINDNTRQRAGH